MNPLLAASGVFADCQSSIFQYAVCQYWHWPSWWLAGFAAGSCSDRWAGASAPENSLELAALWRLSRGKIQQRKLSLSPISWGTLQYIRCDSPTLGLLSSTAFPSLVAVDDSSQPTR